MTSKMIKLKGWYALSLLWGALVAFLIYRDIRQQSAPPPTVPVAVDPGPQASSPEVPRATSEPMSFARPPSRAMEDFTPAPVAGFSEMMEGEPAEAIEAEEGAPGGDVFASALAAMEEGRTDEARRLLQKRLAENPNDPQAHLGLGIVERLEGHPDQALARLNESLRLDPTNVDAKFNVAEILTFEKPNAGALEKAEAEKHFVGLLQEHPDHYDLRNGLAAVYLQTGKVDQAIQIWEGLSRDAPEESLAHSNLSEAYLEAGRIEEAIAASQKALQADPNNSDAQFHLGMAALAQGDRRSAAEAIQKAAELEPGNQEYEEKLKELSDH